MFFKIACTIYFLFLVALLIVSIFDRNFMFPSTLVLKLSYLIIRTELNVILLQNYFYNENSISVINILISYSLIQTQFH